MMMMMEKMMKMMMIIMTMMKMQLKISNEFLTTKNWLMVAVDSNKGQI